MADLKAKFEQGRRRRQEAEANVPTTTRCSSSMRCTSRVRKATCPAPKPGFFDFVGTAKYEAWAKLKGMKAEEAMQKYTDLVKKLGG